MLSSPTHILLVDDDADDRIFFKEALEELPVNTKLSVAFDGVELMQKLLVADAIYPDLIFLDLNMPRKNGFDCLVEIKENASLKHLQVIIYSTSLSQDIVELLHEKGAHLCIKKPAVFKKLKETIYKALQMANESKPDIKNFVISDHV